MAAERIIGVDFGTSTSVIRVKRYENGEPIGEKLETKEVIFGGSGAMVPTLIMKKDEDETVSYFGHEAQQKKRHFTNFHSFKVELESADPVKRAQARKLTEEFFAFMAKQYQSQSEGGHLGNSDDKERTIISYPVKWSRETKQFMIDTAVKAGFPNVTGIDEAQAVIKAVTIMSTDYLRNHGLLKNGVDANILLVDMGAGTTDLVLCRYTPGSAEPAKILNTWPKSGDILFGGKEIDILLQNFFRDKMDEENARKVFSRVGADKFKAWKEETVSPALRHNDSVSDFEALDNCIDMMEIDMDMDEYCLDRAGFEECLKDYLKQLPVLINDCIKHSGIKGADVDLVIVTGGHSQWYFVQEMLAGKMPQFGSVDLPKIKENPSRIVPITRPQETVALGLVYSDIASLQIKKKHAVFCVRSTLIEDGKKVMVRGNVWGNEPFANFEHIAVYNHKEEFLGDCKACVFEDDSNVDHVTKDSKNVTIELSGFTGEIHEDMDINFLITMPVDENTYDQVLADLEDEGYFRTQTSYVYEDSNMDIDDIDFCGAYFFYVTEIKDDKIYGRRIRGEMDSDHLEQYVYSKDDYTNGFRQKLNWERHTSTGHNACFEADCSNVHVGDIITDCITPPGYTFKCKQINSRRYCLTIALLDKVVEEQYTPESEFALEDIGEDCCRIKGYKGGKAVVSIPPMIRGRKVVEIGMSAFISNITVKTVMIPDTVRRIEESAFMHCDKLETVIAHKDIEFIGRYAFSGCENLQTMDFGMGQCGNKIVKFPKNLKTIGFVAFRGSDINDCVLREVTLSRNTKVENLLWIKTFPPECCAVFYYQD